MTGDILQQVTNGPGQPTETLGAVVASITDSMLHRPGVEHDPYLADDLVQDGMVMAMRVLNDPERVANMVPTNVAGWLWKIVDRKRLDYLKQPHRRRTVTVDLMDIEDNTSELQPQTSCQVIGALLLRAEDYDDTQPEEALLAKDEAAEQERRLVWLYAQIARLNPRSRAAVLDFAIRGLSHEVAGARAGVSENVHKSRYNRGLQALRALAPQIDQGISSTELISDTPEQQQLEQYLLQHVEENGYDAKMLAAAHLGQKTMAEAAKLCGMAELDFKDRYDRAFPLLAAS